MPSSIVLSTRSYSQRLTVPSVGSCLSGRHPPVSRSTRSPNSSALRPLRSTWGQRDWHVWPVPRIRRRAQCDATVETDFTEGDAPTRLTEDLLGEHTTGLAILAPHGGRIERGTDLQADSVYTALELQAKPVRAWIARGFNPAGAHKCWHITSSEISEHSFPKLGSLFASTTARGPYAHAVAFHGHNDSEAIVVGGGLPRNDEHTALKTELSSKIRIALEAVVDPPPVVEVGLRGPLAGTQRKNIVNRVTVRGNGIQIEQPAAVRDDEAQREAVARAVAEFYSDLIEEDHR